MRMRTRETLSINWPFNHKVICEPLMSTVHSQQSTLNPQPHKPWSAVTRIKDQRERKRKRKRKVAVSLALSWQPTGSCSEWSRLRELA